MGSTTAIIEAVISYSDFKQHRANILDLVEKPNEVEINEEENKAVLLCGRVSVSSCEDIGHYCSKNEIQFYAIVGEYEEVSPYKIVVSKETQFSFLDSADSEIEVSRAMTKLREKIESSNLTSLDQILLYIDSNFMKDINIFNYPKFI